MRNRELYKRLRALVGTEITLDGTILLVEAVTNSAELKCIDSKGTIHLVKNYLVPLPEQAEPEVDQSGYVDNEDGAENEDITETNPEQKAGDE